MSVSIVSKVSSAISTAQKMDSVSAIAKKDWAYSRVELYLDNVILSDDKISPSPSEKDGLDSMSEYDLRYIGCELIQTAGILLKLPQVAMATAQVLFQRFYYFKSFVNNPMEIFAMGSLVLASKIEEAIRRNRDIINVFHYLKYKRANLPPEPLMLDGNYQYIKNQVIKAERKLLRELGFCVHVKHPHKLITCFLQALGCDKRRVLQTAWNYMNDGLRTDIFVRYSPDTIACACIYLSARQHKIVFPTQPPWYEVFKCSEDQLKDIALNIMYVYVHQAQPQEELEEKIQALKDQQAEAKSKARTAAASGGLSVNNSLTNTSVGNRPGNLLASSATSAASAFNNNNNLSNIHKSNSASANQSPYSNSRNTSPSSKDKKEKKSRKRPSRSPLSDDSLDSDSHISKSTSHGESRGSKHQKRKHNRDHHHHYHQSSNYGTNNNNIDSKTGGDYGSKMSSRNGDKSKKHKHKMSSPSGYENGNASPIKRHRKASEMSISDDSGSSPDQSSNHHVHKSKKHKKNSRDKHKKSHKMEYKERSSRYY
ncbi:cyclin-L1-like [Convolutriloba macropyga]|uniref:cyclin-L1-like n=1 Tax=Convolutriloba macropyga TaxID=536237 RepID=UPI003F521009